MPPDTTALTEPAVGIVVVNWNGWAYTLEAHRSLVESRYRNWTLIIIDNASSDDSIAQITRNIPSCILIRSATNLGFSGGCNLGIEKAVELGMDYIFLLNNDARVVADTVTALVEASVSLEDQAVLGSVVRYRPSDALQFFGSKPSTGRGRPEWFTWPEDAAMLEQKLIKSDFVFGAALFAPTRLFQEIGLFDDRFFLNYEETDWCYRARARHVPLYVVSASLVYHRESASLGALDGPLQSYFMHRNRMLFYDKHGSLAHRIRGFAEVLRYLAIRLGHGTRLSWRRGVTLDPSTRALILAVRDYLLRRFGDCPDEVRRLARSQAVRQDL